MARPVVWTDTGWSDLQHVADYIAEDSPGYSAAFVQRLREQAGLLDKLAARGRMVPELGDPIVREMLIGNYRLIYEIRSDRILILGLIHAARDLAALWERERRSEP